MSGEVDEAGRRVAPPDLPAPSVLLCEEANTRDDREIEAELRSKKSTIESLMPFALLSVDLLLVVPGTLSMGCA